MAENPWLQVADAARYLGISPTTLRKWSDAGDVPYMRTKAGHRRFLISELDQFIKEHRGARPIQQDEVSGNGVVGHQEMVGDRVAEG